MCHPVWAPTQKENELPTDRLTRRRQHCIYHPWSVPKGGIICCFQQLPPVHNRPLEQARCLSTLAATPSVQLGAECSTSCACAYPLNLISTEWKFSTHHHLPNWSVAMLSFTSRLMHVVANAWTYSPRLISLHRFIYCLVGVNDTKKL